MDHAGHSLVLCMLHYLKWILSPCLDLHKILRGTYTTF